jgi:hypothetical protein
METIRIDILNPKAKSLLENLVDLNLIHIKKEPSKSDFKALLAKLRKHSEYAISPEEIALEVEEERKIRYEK